MVEVFLIIIISEGCISIIVYLIFFGSGGGVGNVLGCQVMFFFEQDVDDLLFFIFMDMFMGIEIDFWFWSFGDGNSSMV